MIKNVNTLLIPKINSKDQIKKIRIENIFAISIAICMNNPKKCRLRPSTAENKQKPMRGTRFLPKDLKVPPGDFILDSQASMLPSVDLFEHQPATRNCLVLDLPTSKRDSIEARKLQVSATVGGSRAGWRPRSFLSLD